MITTFWTWLTSSVTNAVNILSTLVSNTIMAPFFNLFLVVIALMVIVKYILKPIFGGGSGSDKAKKKGEEEQ